MNPLHLRHGNDLPGLDSIAQAAQDWLASLVWTPLSFTYTPPVEPTPIASSAGSVAFTGTLASSPILNANNYTITTTGYDQADQAVNGPAARAIDVPNTTTLITGAGITIGILSDSFNNGGGEAAAQGNGYLPSNINILKDLASGGSDEGQAMAEIIHSIAPGVTIDFYTAFNSEADFAAGITALANAGASIIVDDVSYDNEPFFQNAGAVTLAAEQAISRGINYFTSAGNFASDYYQGTFNAVSNVALNGLGSHNTVSEVNSTPYVQTTISAGASVAFSLQWSQPFASTGGGSGSSYGIEVGFFDSSFTLIKAFNEGTISPIGQDPVVTGTFNNTSASSTVYMAFIQDAGSANGATFKILFEDNGGLITGPLLGSGSGAVFGHALATGVNAVGAISVSQAPSGNPEYFSSTGPGEILYNTAGQLLSTPVVPAQPAFLGPDGSSTTTFNPFGGTSAAAPAAAAVAALVLQADPGLSTSQVTSLLESTATKDGNTSANIAGAGLINANAAVTAAVNMVTACYCPGTLIETEQGERAIETLAIGDLVRTVSGALRPIRWIGRRSYLGRFARRNPDLLPVLFLPGSLADGIPRRDLLVSPRHAMYLDDVLIEAALLVNATTILHAPPAGRIHYVHVELDSHDVMLAEGAASESFVDDNSRAMFHNAHEYHQRYPNAIELPAVYCAPRIDGGFVLQAVLQRLAERAGLREPATRTGLIGCVDHLSAHEISGWAHSPDQGTAPVCLDIMLDGVLIGQTLANLPRSDLLAAGIGEGRHGFRAMLPLPLDAGQRQRVELRRSGDQMTLHRAQATRAA